MSKIKNNPPSADILINSMRSIGYSFESAVADVIDNSISASAKKILIESASDPLNLYFYILDDGIGMSYDELEQGMKYGSHKVDVERKPNDLGRFGLGLKSASLSQCRVLTVISKKNGSISAFSWDLDLVMKEKEWAIIDLSEDDLSKYQGVKKLQELESGTLVIWTHFDFLEKSSNGSPYNEFMRKVDDSATYCRLIFHRYIEDELTIIFNNRELKLLDPFLTSNKKTDKRKEITVFIKNDSGIEYPIIIQPYVLPYSNDLSNDDVELLGGLDKLLQEQGFYIYRNKRLIIWGKWFRLKLRSEDAKYARIRVDIPNTLDDIWSIDIKKQNATLPMSIRNTLVSAIEETYNYSSKKTRVRTVKHKQENNIKTIWYREEMNGKFTYKIDRDNQFIKEFDVEDSETYNRLDRLLNYIELCLPVQSILVDVSSSVYNESLSKVQINEMVIDAVDYFNKLVILLNNREAAYKAISKMEPYCNYPEVINLIEEKIKNGE